MLSYRAHGSVGLRSSIFYAITLCIRAFHMTSIVISLYFKQENCETLISPYNWGQMKHCQSELVSYKVEWFCSPAVFSRWPGPLFISLCLSVSLLCLSLSFVLILFFSFFFKEKLYSTGPGGEGCIIRVPIVANYSCCKCILSTCCLPFGMLETSSSTSHKRASAF